MPTFADVRLLLPCDGTNGSTTFPDESNSALTVTASSGAQITTAHSKWGGSSADMSDYDGRLTVSSTSALGLGTGAWTFETWVRLGTAPYERFPFYVSTNLGGTVAFGITSSGRMQFSTNSGIYISGSGTAQIPTETWTHVAWCYDGTNIRAFIGGVQAWISAQSPNLGASSALICGYISRDFWLDDIRITAGAWYTSGFTPPADAFETESVTQGRAADSGPLRQPSVLANVVVVNAYASDGGPLGVPSMRGVQVHQGRIGVDSPLGAPRARAVHDFTAALPAGLPSRYLCDLVTPGGLVRVSISSWQATLQTTGANYLQAVIPACTDYVADLTAATEFVITRAVTLDDGMELEYEMARSDLEQLSLAQGAFRYTATIAGYSDPAAADPEAANPALARELTGVQTITVQSGFTRVRCGIDWLLRPGNTATAGDTTLTASYINLYVSGVQAYMDVGER